jgi:hypothetical protein
MMEDRSIEDLRARVLLGSALVKMLRRDPDPRAQEAADRLQDQQREINRVLVAKIKASRDEEPPPVVVGLKPVIMTAQALG